MDVIKVFRRCGSSLQGFRRIRAWLTLYFFEMVRALFAVTYPIVFIFVFDQGGQGEVLKVKKHSYC